MNSPLQTLHLSQPLRAVRFATPAASGPEPVTAASAAEQALYEKGRLEAEQRMSEQLLRQRQEMSQLQQGVLRSLSDAVPEVVRQCEQALTALTVELARKLVAGLPVSAEMVEAAVQEALGQVEETTEYHLYLNPEDLDLLQRVNSPLLAPHASAPQFHFHRSPEVSAGGCLVKTRFGILDAQRESKAELLKKSLLPSSTMEKPGGSA